MTGSWSGITWLPNFVKWQGLGQLVRDYLISTLRNFAYAYQRHEMTQSGWSQKISWIELCLCDWTGFVCSGNFQSSSPFVFYFNQLSFNSPLFTFSAHIYSLPQTLSWLTCILLFACPELQFLCYSQINTFLFWQFWTCLILPFCLGQQPELLAIIYWN